MKHIVEDIVKKIRVDEVLSDEDSLGKGLFLDLADELVSESQKLKSEEFRDWLAEVFWEIHESR